MVSSRVSVRARFKAKFRVRSPVIVDRLSIRFKVKA